MMEPWKGLLIPEEMIRHLDINKDMTMRYIILLSSFLIFNACSNNNEVANVPTKENKPMEKGVATQLDFKALFEIAEQESLEIYNPREKQLQAAENINILSASSFMKALLPAVEEGSTRQIKLGKNHGITGSPDQDFFIVIEDKLPDDSIKSDIRFFELRKTKNAWSIASVSSVWSCYPGRGHQDFSTKQCQ